MITSQCILFSVRRSLGKINKVWRIQNPCKRSLPKDIFSLGCVGLLTYPFLLQVYTCVRDQRLLVGFGQLFLTTVRIELWLLSGLVKRMPH